MTIKDLKTSDLLKKIETCKALVTEFAGAFNSGGLVHETACESLLHIYKHGDVMPAQRLYEAVGGIVNRSLRTQSDKKTLVKAEALALWFLQMSGKQITVRKNAGGDYNWALADKWNRSEDFWNPLLEAAEKTPITEYAQEERVVIRPVYAGQILNQLDNFINRVKESIPLNVQGEKPRFEGDPDVTLQVLKDISDFAHKRVEQEDVRALGMAKEGNIVVFPEQPKAEGDKLLRDGEEVVQNEQRAAVG